MTLLYVNSNLVEESNDFTVIESSDFIGEGTVFELNANISIAKNLSAPVIIVNSGKNKTTAQIVTNAIAVFHNFRSNEVEVLAIVINRVQLSQVEDVKQLLAAQLNKDTIIAVIPFEKNLQSPTIKEISEHIGGKIIFGDDQLNNQVGHAYRRHAGTTVSQTPERKCADRYTGRPGRYYHCRIAGKSFHELSKSFRRAAFRRYTN